MEKTEIEILRALLIDANIALRSCHEVIERKGEHTMWETLERRISQVLKEENEYFFPTIKQIRKKKLNRINEQNPE